MRVVNGYRIGLLVCGVAGLLAAGCASNSATNQPDPTTRALNDPMGYSPNWDDTDITGGGVSDFNSKEFHKDVNDVVNP